MCADAPRGRSAGPRGTLCHACGTSMGGRERHMERDIEQEEREREGESERASERERARERQRQREGGALPLHQEEVRYLCLCLFALTSSCSPERFPAPKVTRLFRVIDSWLWKGYRESRRCSRDTYPESCITKYTSIRRKPGCQRMYRSSRHCLPCARRFGSTLISHKVFIKSFGKS